MKSTSNKVIFRSRYDWWLLLCLAIAWIVTVAGCIGMPWWVWVTGPGLLTALYVVCFAGMWYEIDGQYLVVYTFFRPTRLPIMKIKRVKAVNGFLASAAGSTQRLSISFTDRSVLKSHAPLEISPKHPEAFIAMLKAINPEIETVN